MGTTSDHRHYDTDNRKEIEAKFKKDAEQARYEDGNDSYSGSIGQKTFIKRWSTTTFSSTEDAETWCNQNSAKWDQGAAAAYYYLPAKPTGAQQERAAKASQERRAAELELEQVYQAQVSALVAAKGKTVKCKGCGSSLSRQHLRGKLTRGNGYQGGAGCPLCSTNLLPKAMQRAIDRACAKVDKAKAKEEKAVADLRRPSDKRGVVRPSRRRGPRARGDLRGAGAVG